MHLSVSYPEAINANQGFNLNMGKKIPPLVIIYYREIILVP